MVDETCPLCGYNLTGLGLPCVCPECGRTCDPPRDRAAAHAWYRSRAALFCWKPPPRFVCYLDDPACLRTALRRFLVWLAIPWSLAILTIVATHSVVLTTREEHVWETPDHEVVETYVFEWHDRLLSTTLHGYSGPFPPADGVERTRILSRSMSLSMPSLADKYLQTFLLPVSVGVLASVTAALIISALIFLQTGTVRLRNSWSTMLAAVALTLPGYAVGALIHAGLCVVYALYAVGLIVPSQTAFIRTLWQGAELAVLVWIGFVTIQILRGVRSRRERFSLFVVAPAAALVVTMPVVVLWMTI